MPRRLPSRRVATCSGATAATALSGSGTPPTDDLVHALRDAGRDFAALRAEALAAAGAAGVTAPPAEAIASTRHLEDVLRALVQTLEVEERRAALARVRAEALAVLDRVAALVHRDDPAFAALARCHKRANAVRAALAASSESDPERERAAAAEATAINGPRWRTRSPTPSAARWRPPPPGAASFQRSSRGAPAPPRRPRPPRGRRAPSGRRG